MNGKHRMDASEVRSLVLDARSKEGPASAAAFEQLVLRLQDFAVGAAYAYLRDTGLAQDAAQESFVIAWRHLQKLKQPEVFIAWFKRIIASQCHRVLRKKSGRLEEWSEAVTRADGEDLEALVGRRERQKLLLEALDQLPAAERLAIVLFYYAGRSHAAIASFLGVPESTILKRLYTARQRLKAALSPLRAEVGRVRPSRSKGFAMVVRAGIYNDYVGLYRFEERPELTVRIERVGNRLVSFSAGQKNTVIPGVRLSELRAKEFDGRARFMRSKAGRVTHFIYYEFGKRMGVARKR